MDIATLRFSQHQLNILHMSTFDTATMNSIRHMCEQHNFQPSATLRQVIRNPDITLTLPQNSFVQLIEHIKALNKEAIHEDTITLHGHIILTTLLHLFLARMMSTDYSLKRMAIPAASFLVVYQLPRYLNNFNQLQYAYIARFSIAVASILLQFNQSSSLKSCIPQALTAITFLVLFVDAYLVSYITQ